MGMDREGFRMRIFGIDVAEQGKDLTVITIVDVQENKYKTLHIKDWGKTDTMPTVGKIMKLIDEYRPDKIRIDAIGVGKGVFDRLKELQEEGKIKSGIMIEGIKVGMSAKLEPERFLNVKAQMYWSMRTAFEEGRIKIPKHSTLLTQLNNMRYELTSAKKIRIVDPGTKTKDGKSTGSAKSPDFCDSLALVFAETEKETLIADLEL